MARGRGADWVLRYVHAKYNDPSGTAVFRESFNRTFHMRDDVLPVSSQPIMVGQDFGRDPCSIIGQLDHKEVPLGALPAKGAYMGSFRNIA
jgi:hypothetical protein